MAISWEDQPMECFWCGVLTDNVETAIEAGWSPSYWIGNEEVCDPVCCRCCELLLEPEVIETKS